MNILFGAAWRNYIGIFVSLYLEKFAVAESEEVLNNMEESAVIKDLGVCPLPDAPPETRLI